jgi:membrane fusion protein, multidrug efflux system
LKAARTLAFIAACAAHGATFAQAPATAPAAAPIAPPAAKPAPRAEVAALITPVEESTLSAQMAGKIRHISIGLGDQVKKGAHLIAFDCSEQQAQLEAAAAEYRAARETHLARMRLQALGAAGELDVKVAAAAAEKARSQLNFRESQIAYCTVEAPFSGNVARLRVKPAESVTVGQPLIDLVNTAALKAQMFVPAAWIGWLKTGTPVSISIKETGQVYEARISKMNARVDGVSQQLEVEAQVDKGEGRLLPGTVGTALFEPPTK